MIGLHVSKNKRKQNGYTLIELLLVLTVLALLASLAVKTYRDKALSDRINIAALNIQHVLESGMSYNVANTGMWPEKNFNPCNSGSAVKDQTFVNNYLPNESNQSNFGNPLCWNGDDPNDSSKVQQGKRFWVALNVGSDQAATNIAQRIAARLPNAIITSTPDVETTAAPSNTCTAGQACYVKAVVSVPSATTDNNNKLTISALGYCDPNVGQVSQPGSGVGASCTRTTLGVQFGSIVDSGLKDLDSLGQYQITFQCKPNETPKLYVNPDFLREARYSSSNQGVDSAYQLSGATEAGSADSENKPTVCKTKQDGSVTCTVTLKATYDAQSGYAASDVGCTNPMLANTGGTICNCPVINAKGDHQCPDTAGGIGASYVAACAAPSAAGLAENNKNIW